MENPEKLATLSTQDKIRRQTKQNTTQNKATKTTQRNMIHNGEHSTIPP